MKKTARHIAVDILDAVHQSQAFAGDLLDESLETCQLTGTADGRLLTHLVYGVLRMQGQLDWILAQLYRGNFAKMEEGVRNILRTGLYQLKFSDRLPDFAVVDEAVKIAKRKSHAAGGLVNAILRSYLRNAERISFPSLEKDPDGHIAAFYSHPLWLVKIWTDILGRDETLALCSANNGLPPVTVRVNTLKISRTDLQDRMMTDEFPCEPTRFSPDGLIISDAPRPLAKTLFFQDGLLRLQDEAAQLISLLLNPQPEESILDACAGSGGKAGHIAALMSNEGRITALDRSTEKIAQMKTEAARLGISIMETSATDLIHPLSDDLAEKFDRVLVDAPCSGTGTLRRNPEIKWRLRADDLSVLAKTQQRILRNASRAVKKGGVLVYCTCSLLPAENDEVVRLFLAQHPEYTTRPPDPSFPDGLTDSRGFLRTYPHRHNMDGFFAAVLQRRN